MPWWKILTHNYYGIEVCSFKVYVLLGTEELFHYFDQAYLSGTIRRRFDLSLQYFAFSLVIFGASENNDHIDNVHKY